MSSCLMFGKCNRGWSDAYIIDSQETLEQLLGQITPDNVHSEIDFGQPVGKELL